MPGYIPPSNGRPVTTRSFSLLEMVSREWGSEFRAPDHRVYLFAGWRGFDSTDMGTTGFYRQGILSIQMESGVEINMERPQSDGVGDPVLTEGAF